MLHNLQNYSALNNHTSYIPGEIEGHIVCGGAAQHKEVQETI